MISYDEIITILFSIHDFKYGQGVLVKSCLFSQLNNCGYIYSAHFGGLYEHCNVMPYIGWVMMSHMCVCMLAEELVTQWLFPLFYWQLRELVVAERGCKMDNVHGCNRANLQ